MMKIEDVPKEAALWIWIFRLFFVVFLPLQFLFELSSIYGCGAYSVQLPNNLCRIDFIDDINNLFKFENYIIAISSNFLCGTIDFLTFFVLFIIIICVVVHRIYS